MHGLIKENLMKGIKQNLYRKTIDIDFIGRIYFQGMTGIKNKDLFPLNNYSMLTLTNYHLEYHLRGICTSKGLEELNKQLSNNQKYSLKKSPNIKKLIHTCLYP